MLDASTAPTSHIPNSRFLATGEVPLVGIILPSCQITRDTVDLLFVRGEARLRFQFGVFASTASDQLFNLQSPKPPSPPFYFSLPVASLDTGHRPSLHSQRLGDAGWTPAGGRRSPFSTGVPRLAISNL